MNDYENLLVSLKAVITPEMNKDINKLIEKLEQDKKTYHDQLLQTRDRLVRQDYELENKRKALESAKGMLERYEQENHALKSLLVLEWD